MQLIRRQLLSLAVARLALALAAAGAFAPGPANSQADFPNRPIHVVVPYTTGGVADVATRIVTDKLSEIWHQPIVVETKPGASGNLAWDQVSRAKPDGYTWTFIGALLPLFRLVGIPCIAAFGRVKSLLCHHSDRPKLANRSAGYFAGATSLTGVPSALVFSPGLLAVFRSRSISPARRS